jgi:tRNA threonylcarbamoyl adenosine modification protein YeaZ
VGVATARGLAQSLSAELVGVSSLRALAEAVGTRNVVAVIDARRGELFTAAYSPTERGDARQVVSPRALAPERLPEVMRQANELRAADTGPWLAVGDGAVRFRSQLEKLGVEVAPDASPAHLVGAQAVCELGIRAQAVGACEEVLPDYRRRPDAEIALEDVRARKPTDDVPDADLSDAVDGDRSPAAAKGGQP